MEIQRLRNLTTGRLHTKMEDIYADIEWLTDAEGIFTNMLPNACRALEPYLRDVATEPRLWDGAYDPQHVGTIDMAPMGNKDKAAFWARYGALARLSA